MHDLWSFGEDYEVLMGANSSNTPEMSVAAVLKLYVIIWKIVPLRMDSRREYKDYRDHP